MELKVQYMNTNLLKDIIQPLNIHILLETSATHHNRNMKEFEEAKIERLAAYLLCT